MVIGGRHCDSVTVNQQQENGGYPFILRCECY